VITDNSTAVYLRTTISSSCQNTTSLIVSPPFPYNSSVAGSPKPEQSIQYYRASSVVLTLDGYNDTIVLSSNSTGTPIPLPSGVDIGLLNCVNQTIGFSVPLVGASSSKYYAPLSLFLVFLAWTIWLADYW